MGKFIKKKDIWSLSLCTLAILGSSQVLADTLVPVTEKNYEFAESDLAFKNITKLVGSNQWFHFSGLTPLDNQTVVRMNRDTIYSGYVADLSQGGSITIPDVGKRYISIMVVQNDHYIDQVFSKPG
ncbi:lytic murein transglycosylase, partial [Vibrio parahaemolyticus]